MSFMQGPCKNPQREHEDEDKTAATDNTKARTPEHKRVRMAAIIAAADELFAEWYSGFVEMRVDHTARNAAEQHRGENA